MSRSLTKALLQPATLLAVASLIAAGLPADAKRPRTPINRGLEPATQPVVQRTDFVFDAVPNGSAGLSILERQRIRDWFDAIQLGYGDRVSIAGDGLTGQGKAAGTVGDIVGTYGLLMADRAPVTVGDAPAGALRIIVSRSTASVPSCPDWREHFEADLVGGLSHDYGCAVNGNLAAMIANPEDMVRGRQSDSRLREAVGVRAVRVYRAAQAK